MALLLFHVGAVFFVLVAVVLEDVGVGEKLIGELDGKGFGVHLGVVKGHFDIHVPVVAAAVAFHDVQGFAVGVAETVEPGFVVEAGGLDHERVAFPSADGVAEPGWLRHFLGKRPTVCVDLAMACGFEQDDDQPG
jgi:hypothetical protein